MHWYDHTMHIGAGSFNICLNFSPYSAQSSTKKTYFVVVDVRCCLITDFNMFFYDFRLLNAFVVGLNWQGDGYWVKITRLFYCFSVDCISWPQLTRWWISSVVWFCRKWPHDDPVNAVWLSHSGSSAGFHVADWNEITHYCHNWCIRLLHFGSDQPIEFSS